MGIVMKMCSLTLESRSSFNRVALNTAALHAAQPLWLGALLAGLLGSACVEDVDPPAMNVAASGAGNGSGNGSGSAGSGSQTAASAGSPGSNMGGAPSSGSGGAGGSNPYAADETFGKGVACPPPAQALLSDFTYVGAAAAGADAGAAAPNTTGVSFGDFISTFSGSTYVYPTTGSYAVQSDVTGGNWHLTGTLGDYSGFGITFNNCYRLDASAYRGISFQIQDSVPMGNMIMLNVGTAENEISHLWLNAMTNPATPVPTNAGRCIPLSGQYDGSCGSPTYVVPVSAEPTVIEVTWAQLTNGRPAATVDPSELTFIAWNFPPPGGAGSTTPTTYDVDIVIDDLRLIPEP